MLKIGIFAAPLLLCGCVTAKPVALPNGHQGLAIDCGGPYEISDCMNKAAQVCGGRYEIISPVDESSRGIVPVGGVFVQANDRIMIVSCSAN